ncbi:MAG: hypothetical protein JSS31_07715 [Proteobacteria bacterium]|nr:hypothetical protein [Pseudomonadota bacterium]
MGLVAPVGTPRRVMARLNKAISTATTDASFRTIRQQGSDPVFSSAAVTVERLASDVQAYAKVIKTAGIVYGWLLPSPSIFNSQQGQKSCCWTGSKH